MPANKTSRLIALPLAAAVFACQAPADEYRAALPDRSTLEVKIPGSVSAQSQGLIGRSGAGLVGEQATFYLHSYASSKELNFLGRYVVELVDTITDFPPTVVDERHALWGPFSDARDPNEFSLGVEKDGERYSWVLSGQPKGGNSTRIEFATGIFEPGLGDHGRGWFALDFDGIKKLDPSEDAQGKIAYAFEKNDEGTQVRAVYETQGEAGPIQAAYAFGENTKGEGFILFALPADLDEAQNSRAEDLLIRTRWTKSGAGRADVFATGGDLETSLVQLSQCWDNRFVSTYESIQVDGRLEASDGEEGRCALLEPSVPKEGELPNMNEIAGPKLQ